MCVWGRALLISTFSARAGWQPWHGLKRAISTQNHTNLLVPTIFVATFYSLFFTIHVHQYDITKQIGSIYSLPIIAMKPRKTLLVQLHRAVNCTRWPLFPSVTSTTLPVKLPANRQSRAYTSVSVSAANLSFGQPLHETHPHLLRAGEG